MTNSTNCGIISSEYKILKKGDVIIVSWVYDKTNPVNTDMFRLDELYNEEIDDIKYTEAELEIIEQLKKSGSL